MGSVLRTTTTTTLFIYLFIVIYHTVIMFSTCAITLSLLLSVVNCLEDVSIYEDEASDPRLFFIATNPQSRYYSNGYSNSQYYSQARMLHDMGSTVMGDWDLMGLLTKALDVYNKLNDEHED